MTIYTNDLIDNLELRWGEGFLSAGGEDELAVLLSGVDIFDQNILDIGCGTGGIDIILAQRYGAGHVIGVDVEQPLIDRAIERVRLAGMTERIEFRLINSDLSAIPDKSFDIVFSKGSIVHIRDKKSLYEHAYRVLKPNGVFIVGDLYRGHEKSTPEMEQWLKGNGLTLFMETIQQATNEILAAGFSRVNHQDRTSWFRAYCKDEYTRLNGELWRRYTERFGVEGAKACVEGARLKWILAEQGQLRPGHIHARLTN